MHPLGTDQHQHRPARAWWRRALPALAAGLALVLLLAACASNSKKGDGGVASLGESKPQAAGSSSKDRTSEQQRALDFARCMRQHGVDMPDPQIDANGGIRVQVKGGGKGFGPDSQKFKDAQEACKQYLPSGGKLKPSQAQIQKLVQFARCMRAHGVDVPDPGADGRMTIRGGGPGPGSKKFEAAQQACEQDLPGAIGGGK